ncbi:MAG TPA: transposase [Anaerolineae bacterium]
MSKNRTFTPEFKTQVVLQVLTGVKSTMEVCREHQLQPTVFYRWRDEFLQNAPRAFERQDRSPQADQQRIAELEQMVGRLTLQLEIAHLP